MVDRRQCKSPRGRARTRTETAEQFHPTVWCRRALYRPSRRKRRRGGGVADLQDILDGKLDDIPIDALYFSGGLDAIRANNGRELKW